VHVVSDSPCDFGANEVSTSTLRLHCLQSPCHENQQCINCSALIRCIVSANFRDRILHRLLSHFELPFEPSADVSSMHRILLEHADCCAPPIPPAGVVDYENWKQSCAARWPEKLSHNSKTLLLRCFFSLLGLDNLATSVCAVCGAAKDKVSMLSDAVNLLTYDTSVLEHQYPVNAPHPFLSILSLQHIMLCPEGVQEIDDSSVMISICKSCDRCLKRHRLPNTAVANDLFFGPVPAELSDLTLIEEVLIARCRAKSWIIHLRDDSTSPSHTTGAMFASSNPVYLTPR
jgi:hypothetical protein